MADLPWIPVEDYKWPDGWIRPGQREAAARLYCELLERGQILLFRELPFALPVEDRDFLLAQPWAELRLHKNISYRPQVDVLQGVAGDAATVERVHSILRGYARNVVDFAGNFLLPYAGKWALDFSSFRPLEEEGRDLPLHKRNDLLHVDAFPSRPTRGARILRIFTNLNPAKPRVWQANGDFEGLARQYGEDAGLRRIADQSSLSRAVRGWIEKLGFHGAGRTPYDTFMLRFHDYLKENAAFQQNCPKTRLEFPPGATWLVFTDGAAHAAMSGQYAMEQTFLVPPAALVAPEHAPFKILEKIAGCPLVA